MPDPVQTLQDLHYYAAYFLRGTPCIALIKFRAKSDPQVALFLLSMPVLAAPLEALVAFGWCIFQCCILKLELTVRRLHPRGHADILYHPKPLERASFHTKRRPSGCHSGLVCTAWEVRRVIGWTGGLDTPRDGNGCRGSRNAHNRNPLGGLYLHIFRLERDFAGLHLHEEQRSRVRVIGDVSV